MGHDYMAKVETYGQKEKHGHEWKKTNPVAGYAEIGRKVRDNRTPDALSSHVQIEHALEILL
jgi:hypothetical protein